MTYEIAGGYRTREKAERVLVNMFADGIVCEGEQPEVKSRTVRIPGARKEIRYFVTVREAA